MTVVMISLAASSFGASACQKCKDVGFHVEYETCSLCEGKGTVLRRISGWYRDVHCPECGKLGNKPGKVKVKKYCDCQTGKAKKERDEKPRKMTLK